MLEPDAKVIGLQVRALFVLNTVSGHDGLQMGEYVHFS